MISARISSLKETKPHEYFIRFAFGGGATVLAGFIAAHFGPGPGGLFLAFPAIFPATATLIEAHEKKRMAKIGHDGTNRGRMAASIDAAGCKDVILADACDRVGVAPQFDAVEFYENARRCLSRGGVFVANMCGDLYDRAAHFLKIRNVFGDEFMTLRVRPDRNVIVFAFKERRPEIDWDHLEEVAVDLKRRLGLDFPSTYSTGSLVGGSRYPIESPVGSASPRRRTFPIPGQMRASDP